ncbi:hypothetical protein [Streptomyces viridosporus]|uniref:hypothetical protein n=1 Tax=Streptomyces viridosporus TaxID=67581 RepID=UPI000996B5E3|nr:hypothetical protein [Streptomyces viridosporus]
MTIFTKTEQVLCDAMERLLSGRPQHTDGKLTKNNLCREAGVSRVTMHRAAKILTEWDARTATSSAGGDSSTSTPPHSSSSSASRAEAARGAAPFRNRSTPRLPSS